MRSSLLCLTALAVACGAPVVDETDDTDIVDTDETDVEETDETDDTEETDDTVSTDDTDETDDTVSTDESDIDDTPSTDDTDTDDFPATDETDTDVAPTCPDRTGASPVSGQGLVMTVVDWDLDLVRLQNVTGSAIDLSAGDMCRPFFYVNFPSGTTVPANGELTLHLTASGTNTATDIYLNNSNFNLGASDELMVYTNKSNHLAENIAAYVRWGPSAPGGRTTQAVGEGLWTTGEAVTGCTSAIVLTGDAERAAGWSCVDAFATCEP